MEEVFKATFDDSDISKKLEDLEKQVIGIGKAVDTVGDTATASLNQAAGAADNFTASIDKAATDTAKQAKAVEGARAANQSWLQSIKQTIAGQEIGGKSLGEWGEQARNFSAQISQGAKSIGGATGAMRIFNGVLKASGIGLLVGLVASLIQYFTKFQSGIDKVSQVMASLNAITNVLIDRFLKIGSGLLKIVGGDFAAGARELSGAFSGMADEIGSAAVAAFNLEKRLQALRDVTITQSVEAARARVELDKFRQIADDGTRSLGERAKAARNAAAIEKQLADQAVDRALEAQQIAQGQLALNREKDTAKEAAAKAEIDLQEALAERTAVIFNAEKEQREFRKQANEERQKQLEAEAKKAEALRKEYEKLFADIQRQSESLNIENTFNPVERVIKQYQAAIEETNTLRARLLTLAPGEAEKAKVNAAIETLFDELAIKYREELDKAKQELKELRGGKIRDALNPLPPPEQISDDVKFRAKGTIKLIKTSIQEAIDQAAEDEKPFNLADFLKISEDELKGVLSATDQIIESLGNLADARVKEAEAATKAADDKVKAAEDALEKEKELAADGLANNVDAAEKELAKQKELRDAALKEEAKARRAQILLDGASQLSSLITASANIFKTLSGIPFVGIPLAIATIALMFGAFTKAKADALKAASAPKFKHGGEARVTKDGILVGPSHDDGGIGIEAEGGEMVFSDGRKLSVVKKSATQEHFDLLRAVNNDDKAAMVEHLAALTGGHRSDYRNPVIESAPHIARVEKEFREIRETQHTQALTEAYYAAAAKIVQAIEEKEVVTPLTNYKITKKSGRNTLTRVVREEK